MKTEPTNKAVLSRRDALKLLGAAAGASVLANLPSRWSTPQLTAGVLPAHAQGSPCWALTFRSIDSAVIEDGYGPQPDYDADAGLKYWSCQSGCLWLELGPGGAGPSFRFSIERNGYDDYDSGPHTGYAEVLVNLGTGRNGDLVQRFARTPY